MIELTEEQVRAITAAGKTPPAMIDPKTNTSYLLVRKEVYDRLKALLYDDAETGDDQLRALLAQSAAGNGWDEPGMEAYDRYDEELAKRCR